MRLVVASKSGHVLPCCGHERDLRRPRAVHFVGGRAAASFLLRGARGARVSAQLESGSQSSRGGGGGKAEQPKTRAEIYSNDNLDRMELIEPNDKVEDIMTPTSALARVRSDFTLQEGRRLLQEKRVEGVPVVDEEDKVVGVITRHDLRPLLSRRDYKDYFATTQVAQVMSTPPVCVRPHARIGEAAGVMLAYKVHRLPVVDEAGYLLGIVSRTDIFQVSEIARLRVCTTTRATLIPLDPGPRLTRVPRLSLPLHLARRSLS